MQGRHGGTQGCAEHPLKRLRTASLSSYTSPRRSSRLSPFPHGSAAGPPFASGNLAFHGTRGDPPGASSLPPGISSSLPGARG